MKKTGNIRKYEVVINANVVCMFGFLADSEISLGSWRKLGLLTENLKSKINGVITGYSVKYRKFHRDLWRVTSVFASMWTNCKIKHEKKPME